MRNLSTNDGQFQFNLWDLSGEPVYNEVRNEFFKESQAIVLIYDITKKRSFENLQNWVTEVSRSGIESLPFYVVGTKADLDGNRTVPKADAQSWVNQKQFSGYYETSAKDNDGFLRIFREMSETLA